MESDRVLPGPDDPRAALDVAEETRLRFAGSMRLPTGLLAALAVAVAVQIGAAAYGIAAQSSAGLAVALAGVAVFLGLAAVALHHFRRINGVRVDGLASQVVLGTGGISTTVYLGALAAATWAAFDARWWLVVAAAVAGGTGYAGGTLGWWQSYRRDPAAHVGGASPRVLAALGVLACLGLVLLVVAG